MSRLVVWLYFGTMMVFSRAIFEYSFPWSDIWSGIWFGGGMLFAQWIGEIIMRAPETQEAGQK